MTRIAGQEDLTGKVCVCSLGRVGVVTHKGPITFPDGGHGEFWCGMGLDGRGLWCTGVTNAIPVLAETLKDYVDRIKARPSQVLYR